MPLKKEDTIYSTINSEEVKEISKLENSAVTISPPAPALFDRPVISPLASQPFV